MSTTRRTRGIPAPPAAVWATLADFGAIARWAPPVDHSCLVAQGDEPLGTARRVQVGATTLLEEVVAWDPPHLLAYRLRGLPALLGEVRTEWRLESADTAAGDATATATIATVTTIVAGGRRPPARVAARLVARRLGRTADGLLDGLAAHHHEEPSRA